MSSDEEWTGCECEYCSNQGEPECPYYEDMQLLRLLKMPTSCNECPVEDEYTDDCASRINTVWCHSVLLNFLLRKKNAKTS